MKKIFLPWLLLLLSGCDDQNPVDIQKAYITLQGQDKVAIINMNNGDIIDYVDVNFTNTSDMPHYIVIDQTNRYWYCTLISSGFVLKFDLNTDQMVDSVYVGNMPALMAIDEEREYLYISRFMPSMGLSTSSQLVHKIDARTMTIIGTVDIGADSPHGIALSSDGGTLWISSNQSSHFFKIETNRFGETGYQPENFRIGSDVPFSYEINDGMYNPLEIELSQDDSKVFITCSNKMQVRVFDAATGDSLDTIPTGAMPWHLKVSKDDNKIYVVNRMSYSVTAQDLGSGTVDELSDASMSLLHGCALSGNDDLMIVTSPGSGKAYIFNTSDNKLLQTILFAKGRDSDPLPTGVAVVQ